MLFCCATLPEPLSFSVLYAVMCRCSGATALRYFGARAVFACSLSSGSSASEIYEHGGSNPARFSLPPASIYPSPISSPLSEAAPLPKTAERREKRTKQKKSTFCPPGARDRSQPPPTPTQTPLSAPSPLSSIADSSEAACLGGALVLFRRGGGSDRHPLPTYQASPCCLPTGCGWGRAVIGRRRPVIRSRVVGRGTGSEVLS